MPEPPALTPESFEILVVRELRKVGFEVSALQLHRRTTLLDPERGYLLELKGALSGPAWQRPVLIACRVQHGPIGRAEIESLRDHLTEAGVECGLLFGAAAFAPDALQAGQDNGLALLRVTDGRTAFDTSGWGTPGHYPAWLPAYCAQAVGRDPLGEVRYQLLERGQGDLILKQLRTQSDAEPARPRLDQP
ncbi:MAG TPA: restriction endonuclease [Gemmatimonadales bacterium]|nr:restriction endonuclease [Gemmatimonadales bacterium]